MSEKAIHMLMKRIGSGEHTLLAILLDLPETPEWCDGQDKYGRSICFIGKAALGEHGQAAIEAVKEMLALGDTPETVATVAFAPIASRAILQIVDNLEAKEIMLDGPRGTGKTQIVAGALPVLAELQQRAGYPVPIKLLWLHDSLTNAAAKTAESLKQPLWEGLWSLQNDSTEAVFSIAGHAMVEALFVGCNDDKSRERLRAECHLTCNEELIPSLQDAGGVKEKDYGLAFSSARLKPNRRRVAISTTNPGSDDSWPYERWIQGGGRPGTLRIQIPWTDRQTEEEHQNNLDSFIASPDLQARLAMGEWVGLQLGESVAEGYKEEWHVVSEPNKPQQGFLLGMGWDGGHSPSCVIGQDIDGQLRIYASLNLLKVGTLELIDQEVIPWLKEYAPWVLNTSGGFMSLVHAIDPNMATASQSSISDSAEKIIMQKLGGRIVKGPTRWAPRKEAVLKSLGPQHIKGRKPLAINPGPDTKILRKALGGRWFYPIRPDGSVDRTGAHKPNSPYADVGDAFAYLAGWTQGGDSHVLTPQEIKVETAFEVGQPYRNSPDVVSTW